MINAMRAPPDHRCHVCASPWGGVHSTHIESARHYGKHWHATYGLGLLEQGAHRSASGRGRVDAYAGDLITVNPGEVHDGGPLGGPSRRWRIVYLEPQVVAAMAGVPGAPLARDVALTRPVIRDAALRRALLQLFQRLDQWNARAQPTRADALACEEALVRSGALLLQRHSTGVEPAEVAADLRHVRDRLADDLLDPPTLSDMAAMSGLSKYQLLRRFESAYGVTPHAWLLQQRAERARGLIHGGVGLAQVAASCGFADQSHMTRIFARHFGFTPGAWQRAAARSSLQ
jgi:AraC-like DNA-binding protein